MTGDYTEEANKINTSGLIVQELEISKLEHDPSLNCDSTSISEEELEERMICVKKDPYLRHIVEDIETGGPTVMMRYLDDPEVLQNLARAMGFEPNVDTGDQIVDESNPAANMSGNKRKRRSQKRPSKKQRIRRQRHLDDPEVLQKLGGLWFSNQMLMLGIQLPTKGCLPYVLPLQSLIQLPYI